MSSVAVPVIAIICTAVVAIVWIIIDASGKAKKRSPAEDKQLQLRLDEIEEYIKTKLEDRIANLETILTDREYELSKKFKEL